MNRIASCEVFWSLSGFMLSAVHGYSHPLSTLRALRDICREKASSRRVRGHDVPHQRDPESRAYPPLARHSRRRRWLRRFADSALTSGSSQLGDRVLLHRRQAPQEQHGMVGDRRRRERMTAAVDGTAYCWAVPRVGAGSSSSGDQMDPPRPGGRASVQTPVEGGEAALGTASLASSKIWRVYPRTVEPMDNVCSEATVIGVQSPKPSNGLSAS